MVTAQRVIGPSQIANSKIAVNFAPAIQGISQIANEQQSATNTLLNVLRQGSQSIDKALADQEQIQDLYLYAPEKVLSHNLWVRQGL